MYGIYNAFLLAIAAFLLAALWAALQEGDIALVLVIIVVLAVILTGITVPVIYRWIRRKDDKDTGHLR